MTSEKKQALALSVSKAENISEWYTEVIQKADLIEYTSVSGCIIFKPNAYQIWEHIQRFVDARIKASGVRNAYFPLFIPEHLLTREADHVEGFSPEVAWVTEAGDSKLHERLAVRPTSETIMYEAYKKWIQSYRDLPLRINQWNSVVRWEFKHPTPFLRNREFLWNEGHSAFATKEEADSEVREILEYFRELTEEQMAIPVTMGRKSVGETFAGADYSTTIEAFLPDGRVIQAGTSHHLGQNFSKAFDISFFDKEQQIQYPWQNSWAVSTRLIGTMILMHGDDKGLIIPPRMTDHQIVITPLYFKGREEEADDAAVKLRDQLSEYGAFIDSRSDQSPGFRFSEWEMKGVPLRIEIGPRDLDASAVQLVRRDTREKETVRLEDVSHKVPEILESVQETLYDRARNRTADFTVEVADFDEFQQAIQEGKRCLVPWAESEESEEEIKEKTGAKSSCIPFNCLERSLEGVNCFYSGKPATCWAFFAKSH